jgi:hypothetical protein
MKQLLKKLKQWATDYPKEPEESLAELFLLKGPDVASKVLRDGFPFHIRWNSERIRDDN